MIVRLGATENPAEAGGYIGIRATLTAADGAGIRDGLFSLAGCPNYGPSMPGHGQREIVLECSDWAFPVGTRDIAAGFQRFGRTGFRVQVDETHRWACG